MDDAPSVTDSGLLDLISSFLGSTEDDSSSNHSNKPHTGNDQTEATRSEASAHSDSASVRLVIFSKDRPWQLQQLLRSIRQPFDREIRPNSIVKIDIFVVIYASHREFCIAYEKVMMDMECRLNGSPKWRTHFYFEDINFKQEPNSFSTLLRNVLLNGDDSTPQDDRLISGSSEEVVMFLTDDCLLLRPLETILNCAIGSLLYQNGKSRVFNFVSRLHPAISWSQTRNVPSPPPRNKFRYHSLNSSEGVYLYNRNYASGEWSYPFDLSGGIYLRSDVVSLMESISADALSHPNLFELGCNEFIRKNGHVQPLSAIPTRPSLVVLAINRVQDIFKAPLATSTSSHENGKLGIDPSNTHDLLSLLDDGANLDIDRYKTTLYKTSHIGDIFLFGKNNATANEDVSVAFDEARDRLVPKLSVLIPIHNGSPQSASHAIVSVLMQPFDELDKTLLLNTDGESDLFPMQIVLVDDRCTDGSIDAVLKSAESLATLLGISLCVRDLRSNNNQTQLSERDTRIVLDIVSSPRPGVASALNHGLAFCRSEFVARMDADDIAAPNRLLSQLRFMIANPSFNVVGTSTVLFSTCSGIKTEFSCQLPYSDVCREINVDCVGTSRVFGTSLFISDPGFVAWSMLFSCTIQHPSVMFRKSAILSNSGYDENIKSCEDYDLWLRLTQSDCQSVINLPILGQWHRKHEQSKSVVETVNQKNEAEIASYKAVMRLFEMRGDSYNDLTFQKLSKVRNPALIQSVEEADASALLLESIEHVFIKAQSKRLTTQEIIMIRQDIDNRIAEVAQKFVDGSIAWKIWCKRCPEQQLERLSLLCRSKCEMTV